MSCNTEYRAPKEYESVYSQSAADLRLFFRRFSLCVCVYLNICTPWMCVCVHRCALLQVYNSETSVVKPQRSAGICEVSCSGFVIRCKTLTDRLRQQKNQNQLGDVTHCLLIFICDSHWLHERYQGIVSWWWRTSLREKKDPTGKIWWNKQWGERK